MIIDVRSPSEFGIDHIPGAINLPVLSDREHAIVGKTHKDSHFDARKIGAAFVAANISDHLNGPLRDKPNDFHPLIYCARGGNDQEHSLLSALKSAGDAVCSREI